MANKKRKPNTTGKKKAVKTKRKKMPTAEPNVLKKPGFSETKVEILAAQVNVPEKTEIPESAENLTAQADVPEKTEIPESAENLTAQADVPEKTELSESAENLAMPADVPEKTELSEKNAENLAVQANATKNGSSGKEPQTPGETAETAGKPKKSRKKYTIYAACSILLVILLYILAGLPYRSIFLPGTAINEIDVSGMSLSQAGAAINANVEQYILTIEELDGNTEQIRGDAIGLAADYGDNLDKLLAEQNIFLWGIRLFRKENYTIDALITFDEEKLLAAVNSLSCMERNKWKPSVNAYFEYDEKEGYRIVPEIQGTEIETDKFSAAVTEAVDSLKKNISLQEKQIYKQPKVLSETPEMQKQLALLKPYMDMTVTYHFGEETEVLAINTLHDWLSIDQNGRLAIDQECVETFVKELAKKYNTAYYPKTLKTSYGPEVTIKNGFYGWKIDVEGEKEALTKTIRLGKSEDREPVYSQTAASHNTPDYGDTYVEINLTAQHLFYYKDGELLIESDFVSGNPSRGNGTPDGAYALNYKERNAVLRGQNYASHVSYWMPFNGNIGMHDSSWRSTYGGAIYKTNGSHGCINLPSSAAKTIYENIESGVPVLCYFLSGTETGSDPVTLPPTEGMEGLPGMELQIPGNGAQIQPPETGNGTEMQNPEMGTGNGTENGIGMPNSVTGNDIGNPIP